MLKDFDQLVFTVDHYFIFNFLTDVWPLIVLMYGFTINLNPPKAAIHNKIHIV